MGILLILGSGQLDFQQLLHFFGQVERKMEQTDALLIL